jgi:carotenoid cleavage dioxygenase-like enzyme
MPDTSRFLSGSFAPVSEEVTSSDMPVTGRVPSELTGRYLRNGPNPLGLDDPNYHWFLARGALDRDRALLGLPLPQRLR